MDPDNINWIPLIGVAALIIIKFRLPWVLAKMWAWSGGEDDEYPEIRLAGLQNLAESGGFAFHAERSLLLESRLPALSLLTPAASIALNLLSREDPRWETIVFDLGYPCSLLNAGRDQVRSDERRALRLLQGNPGIRVDTPVGPAQLMHSVFAFRLAGTAMPNLSIDRLDRADLAKIPATLHPGFEKV